MLPNPQDPNDRYFITSNELEAYPSHSRSSEVLARDALPEGDRIYQDIFLDSNGKVTFAQWYAVRIIGNRLEPGESRVEKYALADPVPSGGPGRPPESVIVVSAHGRFTCRYSGDREAPASACFSR